MATTRKKRAASKKPTARKAIQKGESNAADRLKEDIKRLEDGLDRLERAQRAEAYERRLLLETCSNLTRILASQCGLRAMPSDLPDRGVARDIGRSERDLRSLEMVPAAGVAITKIDSCKVYTRLLRFLSKWTGCSAIQLKHELRGEPKLGMDQVRQDAMKTPLEDEFRDVELRLRPDDIPPLSTVEELYEKIWKRIPDENKGGDR